MNATRSVLLISAFALALPALAATLTVTSTDDTYPAPAAGSLRASLANAADGDTITFDPSLAGQTITIAGTLAAAADTSLVINGKALTIMGPQGGITINGGWNYTENGLSDAGARIFLVTNTTGVTTFRNLTLKGGHGRGWAAVGNRYFQGGAIGAYGPIRLEDCRLVKNCAADYVAGAPAIRGGGAVYATANVEAYNCLFASNAIPQGSMSYGGAICMDGGSLTATNCVFDFNISRSYCGGIYLSANTTGATFMDCSASRSYNPGGNGVNAGFLWSNMATGKPLDIIRCVFRSNRILATGGMGGAVFAEGAQTVHVVDCEFTDNVAGSGGAIRSHGPTTYLNCTFRGNTCMGGWGPAIDIRNTTYVVNCTFAGNMHYTAQGVQCGGAVALGNATTFLNCVFAYNYLNASTSPSSALDIAKFGGTFSCVNSVDNGIGNTGAAITLATTLAGVPSATKLFAGYAETNRMNFCGTEYSLGSTVVVPTLETDPKNQYFSKVVGIDRDGILCQKGYPVKASANHAYIGYSTNNGSTWTTLVGTDDGTAQPITSDQRGIAYYRNKTPIGAATYHSPVSGSSIVIR